MCTIHCDLHEIRTFAYIHVWVQRDIKYFYHHRYHGIVLSDKFVSASIASIGQDIGSDATLAHRHYRCVQCMNIMAVSVCAPVHHIELWLNSLNASEWASYLLVYTCDQLQYIQLKLQEIWCFCPNRNDSIILHRKIDCTFKSWDIYWVQSNIELLWIEVDLHRLHFGSRSPISSCLQWFNVWRYKSCSMHFHFDLNGWHSSLLFFSTLLHL